MELTDKQWKLIEPLLPEGKSGPGKKGRPRCDDRTILDGIFWILRTGAPWKDPAGRYLPRNTCHRRFQERVQDWTLECVLEAIARDLKERGGLDLREAFIDGSFTAAKRGALRGGNQARKGHQDHGSCRALGSSSRRLHRKCFAA
ncbi:MAG TPA: transposase [bacterium]|nr:transposase [bacterium]